MASNNEDSIMKDPRISSGRFPCWQLFAPLDRLKNPGSLIRCFYMLQTHLLVVIVLLAGQASCNQTSTTPSPLTGSTTAAQIPVSYIVDISVDVTGQSQNESQIIAWLTQVFRTNLEKCVSPNPAQTTVAPTSPQTTPASTFNETTQVTGLQSNSTDATSTTLDANNTTIASTAFEGNNTTAAATTSEGNNTTTAATTLEGNNTATAATSEGNNTTATTSEGNNTATAATSEGNNTTATATTSEGNNTIAAATTSEGNRTTRAATTSEGNNLTTVATTSQGNILTTFATNITSQANNKTTTVATTSKGNNTTTVATTSKGSIFTTVATTGTSQTSKKPTTAAPTSQANNNTTTVATTSKGSNTTTVAPTSKGSIFTTVATTGTSQTSKNPTTAATTSKGSILTTVATTSTSQTSKNPTTAATTSQGSILTTVATTSTSKSNNGLPNSKTTVAATQSSTKLGRRRRSLQRSSNSDLPTLHRSVRQVSGNETQSSLTTNGADTVSLFQRLDVSCAIKTAIRNTTCSVTLKLSQTVPSCCILRALCAASSSSSDFYVVGKRADRVGQLQNECNSSSAEESSCVYSGQDNTACNGSAAAYVVPQNNSVNCSASNINKINCSCSNYCSGSAAYYTFNISIQDPNMNYSYVSSLISKLQQPQACNQTANNPCPLSAVASQYKDQYVGCQNQSTNLQSCRVILAFGSEVSVCTVALAVTYVIQSERQIIYNGQVTRAAICGNLVSGSPLPSEFTWVSTDLTPANFCAAAESNSLTCQNGKNVVVQLQQQEQCNGQVLSTTTTSPNVTSMQPNSTTVVTSTPLNTTTAQLNTTEAVNVTSSAANVSVTAVLNTTTSNTTTTQPSTINLTTNNTTTTNQSTSATTESAEGQARALLALTQDVSKLNSSQVNQLVSQLEALLSGPTVSLALGNTSVNIVSNLLGASPNVLSGSSNRIIGIVDTVGLKLVLGATAQTILSPAVAVSVKPADGANFQQTVFSISNPTNVQVRGAPRQRRSVTTTSSIPQGSIKLPPFLTQNLTSAQQQLVSRVQFNFYQKSTVFQDKSLGVRRLNSGILGASVANLSIKGLQDNVVITLQNKEPIPANFVATCVFWDFALNNGSGGWSSNGCSVQNSTDSETTCGCNHLTSFAILLDLSRKPVTSSIEDTILTYITYIGCGISAIFLSITLLTYLAFGKLRNDIPSKILIQLCLALLMLNLVFLMDAWLALYPDAVGLCISTAWFLHYFLIAAFTWMGIEAIHMYMALVKVFNLDVSRYMLKYSLVGWGIPMLVVIIVISIDKTNYGLVHYGKFSDGTTDDFCWLTSDIAFYVAVVAYFCVIFLFNCIMFVIVMVQLCRLKKQNPHLAQQRSILRDVRSVLGITVLLGLTWGFAFFAWGPVNTAFMYLFAIFNSLQGFFIFVFHCAAKETVRRQWRTYLCCGKMRLSENSDWSRTATQKTGKNSSVTNHVSLRPLKPSRDNNSSSSTAYLAHDFSEQTDGIGSSLADRVITADEDPNMDVVLNEISRRHRNPQTS